MQITLPHEVVVQAPSHVSLSRLEIYINGRIQKLVETGRTLQINPEAIYVSLTETITNSTTARYVKTLENLPTKRIWCSLRSRVVEAACIPRVAYLLFSGPTYIDVDDNGFEPWLEDSQLYK